MVRTLITGIAGFTGHYVASSLAAKGHQIHGIVHSTDHAIEGTEYIYEADLANLAEVVEAVEQIQPQHVLHLAGVAFVGHADVEQVYRSNVVGARQLLEALARLPCPPRSVLLASSASVYGNAIDEVIDESASFAPQNDYGVSKVALEYTAGLYRDCLPIIIARPFNYTGIGQSARYLVPKLVDHVRNRAPVIELGNVEISRDFSDVRDVAEIYSRLLVQPEAIGGTFNICSGRALSLLQVLEMLQSLSGHKCDIRVNEGLIRPNEVFVQRGSKARLEGILGPITARRFEETLSWMLGS